MIYHNILENDIIALRAIEPSDIDLIYDWENNTDNWMVSLTQTPYSRDTIRKFIESADQDIYTIKQLRLMIEAKDIATTVGTIDLYEFDPNNRRAGVGILVAPEFRKKGYAKEALNRLSDYGFQVLNLHQIHANISSDNIPSQRLFTGTGFEQVGVRKDWLRTPEGWLDEFIFQRILCF